MKNTIIALLTLIAGHSIAQMPELNPSKIEVYITPYYNSEGPAVDVGKYSEGLKSREDKIFLSTISHMKNHWDKLSVEELYVAAIRLYDEGYRDESVYWFYTAQLRSRVFLSIIDQAKVGGLGSLPFELASAQNSFFQLAGPYINGYAFGDIDKLTSVLKRIQKAGVPDLSSIYEKVEFIPEAQRSGASAEIVDGLDGFIQYLQEEKETIKEQRKENGTSEKFDKLENRKLTSG